MKNPIEKFLPQDYLRFHSKYERGATDECWLWESTVHKAPGTKEFYGKFVHNYHGPKRQKSNKSFAHRVAYTLAYGSFDYSLHVLHKCDVPLCVNPAHLFLGTNEDNIRDKMKKGRHRIKR
jgi:hypothetical protein